MGTEATCRVFDVATRLTGARAIIQRSHRTFDHSPFHATLDRLVMQSKCPAHRKKRRVFPIRQQNPRPLDPARWLGSRLRYRPQPLHIRISKRQLNRSPPRCHIGPILRESPRQIHRSPKPQMNDNFHGIDRLGISPSLRAEGGWANLMDLKVWLFRV
jgi:hypothetical protein